MVPKELNEDKPIRREHFVRRYLHFPKPSNLYSSIRKDIVVLELIEEHAFEMNDLYRQPLAACSGSEFELDLGDKIVGIGEQKPRQANGKYKDLGVKVIQTLSKCFKSIREHLCLERFGQPFFRNLLRFYLVLSRVDLHPKNIYILKYNI